MRKLGKQIEGYPLYLMCDAEGPAEAIQRATATGVYLEAYGSFGLEIRERGSFPLAEAVTAESLRESLRAPERPDRPRRPVRQVPGISD